MRRNYFIFLEKQDNLQILVKRLLYGADVSRNDQRSLGNTKPGDLVLVWVPEMKQLFGIFEVQERVYYDETDLGWTHLWPYRCQLRLWDGYLRTIPDESKARLMSFVSRELVTLNDFTNLGGYIHSLLYDEGTKLLSFFLSSSRMNSPETMFPEFGSQIQKTPAPKDFSQILTKSKLAEYELEMYLLQRQDKLEHLVGKNITELYNMLFGYQRRYLDIMTVHRDENNVPFKTTIVELKTELNNEKIDTALDELSSYVFWVSDQMQKGRISGSPDSVFGMLVSPHSATDFRQVFKDRRKFYSTQYGIQSEKLHYASYTVHQGELLFAFEV